MKFEDIYADTIEQEMHTTMTANVINDLQNEIHQGNVKAGWWTDLKTGTDLAQEARQGTRLGKALVAEKLALVHSEVSEALEGHRKSLNDDKLTDRLQIEVELADAIIRILDLTGALKLDIGGAIQAKREYNSKREDHQIANRMSTNGKAY
jgi:hypothetical protein